MQLVAEFLCLMATHVDSLIVPLGGRTFSPIPVHGSVAGSQHILLPRRYLCGMTEDSLFLRGANLDILN
jgi:hypothetical protein